MPGWSRPGARAPIGLGVHDDVAMLGRASRIRALTSARARMRVRQCCGSTPERQERDEAGVGLEEAQLARSAPVVSRTIRRTASVLGLDVRGLSARVPTLGLGERLEVRLDGVDLGKRLPRSPPRPSSRRRAPRRAEISPGSLRWSDTSVRSPTRSTVTLWISRTPRDRERRGERPLPQGARRRPPRLDVDDDVAAGQRRLDGRLDRVGDRVALRRPPRPARRPITTSAKWRPAGLPQPQAPQLDGRVERRDRLPGGRLGARRRAVHEHVDVLPHEPSGGQRGRAPPRTAPPPSRPSRPARTREEADRDSHGARQVAREMERVGRERGAAVAPRRATRDERTARVDRDHDADRRRSVHQAASTSRMRPGEPADRQRRRRRGSTSDEDRRLGERREVLGLAVAVRVASGRPAARRRRRRRR